MEREVIIDFVAKIISNGVNKNLKLEEIEDGIKKYIEYLQNQDYVDKDIFRVLNNIVVTLPEMIKLAKIYGSNGITALMLNIPLPERRNNVRNIEATPNPIMKSQSVTVDSCGATIRTSKRSNCGDEINSFGKSSCGDENRTFGRSRC